MKLTYEAWGSKYSIETETDGVDMEETYHLIQQLLLCAGFQPKTVKEYFNAGQEED